MQFLNRPATGRVLRWITHIGALIPGALLFFDFWFYRLGVNPIQEATLRTGKTALTLLVLTLAVTPVSFIFGWKQITPLRRPLGLYAFLYATVHFLIFIWVDYGLSWPLILDAIIEKPYALVGFAALVLMIPLAASSTRWAMKKLGRNWKLLHKLVYVIGVLVVLHYIWLSKTPFPQPALFAALVVLLLVLRLPAVRQSIFRGRSAFKRKRRPVIAKPTAPSRIE
jgi:sulfoxide reductase heme-binding subunit YedZ